jgi:polyhydroxyalkanoate synthesis regulator phasin
MPKHVRHRLISDLKKAADSFFEYLQFEELTIGEQALLGGFKKQIDTMREHVWKINENIENRSPDKVLPIPSAPEPAKKFTWAEHESPAEQLKRQIANLEKELNKL